MDHAPRRRSSRRSVLLVAVLGAAVLGATAGCGGPRSTGPTPAAEQSSGALPSATAPGPGAWTDESAPDSPAQWSTGSGFPPELVGSWRANDQRLEFFDDGSFTSVGDRGTRYGGTAVVEGDQLTLNIDGIRPMRMGWSLRGGTLSLGNTDYLRDDNASGDLSLVGLWINANGYTNLQFGPDGSFRLDDQANGTVTTGSYSTNGPQLTLNSTSRGPATYLIALDGTFLTFSTVDGQLVGEYVRAA